MGTADARRAGHMYAATTYVFMWLPFLYGAACACQDQKSLFDRGPPVLEKFELSTPNLVHSWNSMSVIRWSMSFCDGVHSARAMHVHCVFAQAPLPSGNFDLATRNLVH